MHNSWNITSTTEAHGGRQLTLCHRYRSRRTSLGSLHVYTTTIPFYCTQILRFELAQHTNSPHLRKPSPILIPKLLPNVTGTFGLHDHLLTVLL